MKNLIRQVAGFCRDHPVCWTPLLIGAAIAMALNEVSRYGWHLIVEWESTQKSVLGGAQPLSLSGATTPRAAFVSAIWGTAMSLTHVLVMTLAFVATARLAEKTRMGAQNSAGELIKALKRQVRGIAWFSLQYSVCLFAVGLIGSLVLFSSGVTQLFLVSFLRTSPAQWTATLLEVMAVAYMLAVPAMRLVSPNESATRSPQVESTARKLGLCFAASTTVLGWCWDVVRFNVHFTPAVSGAAATYAANVVTNIPLLMLAVSFVVITAPAPQAEEPEISPAT